LEAIDYSINVKGEIGSLDEESNWSPTSHQPPKLIPGRSKSQMRERETEKKNRS
jgi:hypothetical protein